MRSFVRILVIALLVASAADVHAQSPSSRTQYTTALGQERTLRHDLEASRSEMPPASLLKRARSLVDAFERMSRQYPDGPYMDNALWQGALLASDAYWTFGEVADKTTALRLFAALGSRFPTSSLVKQSPPHVKRLKEARPSPPEPVRASAQVSTSPSPAPGIPAPAFAALTAVRRDVLPDAVRITLEFGHEVTFRTDRIDGPPRVFIDFDNTRAVESIKDATIPFPDDVVRQIRIGRQTDARTRVVMDLAGAGRHSVFALYNPYRVVVDFARATPSAAASNLTVPPALEAASPPPLATSDATPPRGPSSPIETAAPPAPPSVNTSGGFSLARQLGLGVSRIVIDPGHGGHDPGAKTSGLTEADLVLDVALRLEQLFLKHDGVEVVLTRRVDTFVPLEERTAIANREGADLFLSIHANASVNRSARGVETYFLNLTTNPAAEAVAARENAASARSMSQLPDIVRAIALNNKIDESRDFASMIQASLASQLQKTDRDVRNLGVKQAPFMVLLGATMPSVLAEVSFITNRQDATLLKTEKHRQRVAEALYAGVIRYQQSLKRVPAIAEQ